MMRRIKTGLIVLAALMAIVGAASAGYIYLPAQLTVTPQNFSIAPGSTTTITATYITPVNTQTIVPGVVSGSHVLTYNAIAGFPVNVTVTAIYYHNSATGTNTTITPFAYYPATYGGSGNVSWTGPAGTYYIIMQVGASPKATPGTAGAIAFSGSSVNATVTATSITVYAAADVATVYPSITPELFTVVLVGAGAVAIVLLRRRGF